MHINTIKERIQRKLIWRENRIDKGTERLRDVMREENPYKRRDRK